MKYLKKIIIVTIFAVAGTLMGLGTSSGNSSDPCGFCDYRWQIKGGFCNTTVAGPCGGNNGHACGSVPCGG
tara:strand:- start:11375 stop:11587 length:213 start_codon:yes stop_codon:yes gene_type:complete